MFFAPRLTLYDELAQLLQQNPMAAGQAFMDYGAALALAALLVWSTDRWTTSPAGGSFFRVLRMGLLGVVFAAGWQLFCLLTGTELSIVILFIPAALFVAELAYELLEAMLQRERSV